MLSFNLRLLRRPCDDTVRLSFISERLPGFQLLGSFLRDGTTGAYRISSSLGDLSIRRLITVLRQIQPFPELLERLESDPDQDIEVILLTLLAP
jgi:hypothetical protein